MAGVKSTALRFGDDSKKWLSAFTAAMIPGLLLTGVSCDQTWPYYVGVATVIAHLSRQVREVTCCIYVDILINMASNMGFLTSIYFEFLT